MNEPDKIWYNIKSIIYYLEQNKVPESVTLKLSDLEYRIRKMKENYLISENGIDAFFSTLNNPYLSGSQHSAIKKAKGALDILKQNGIKDLTKYGFISLGGGDGTELLYEIAYSKSSFGILFEADNKSINRFIDNRNQLLKLLNHRVIKLNFMAGDLGDFIKLDELKTDVQKEGLEGIIITIHAVLHELSRRSRLSFELGPFLKKIASFHRNTWLVIREPGKANDWPKKVYIQVKPEFYGKFNEIAVYLAHVYFKNSSDYIVPYPEEYRLYLHKDLAIEALTKLFYAQDFNREKNEQVTSVDLQSTIEVLYNECEIILSRNFDTESVEDNFKNYEVKVTDSMGIPQPLPNCFFYILCKKK